METAALEELVSTLKTARRREKEKRSMHSTMQRL